MKEPDWENLSPLAVDRNIRDVIHRDDLVWVVKKTRAKFGAMDKALPGESGIVVSSWNSSMGTHKVAILRKDMKTVSTTASCCKVFGALSESSAYAHEWKKVKDEWMNLTYVPVLILREKKSFMNKKRRDEDAKHPHDFVSSRDKSSVLVKPLMNPGEKVWVKKGWVHPVDWQSLFMSTDVCHTIRIPEWLAKKRGFLGAD
jgi:hypothetical protein